MHDLLSFKLHVPKPFASMFNFFQQASGADVVASDKVQRERVFCSFSNFNKKEKHGGKVRSVSVRVRASVQKTVLGKNDSIKGNGQLPGHRTKYD